MHVCSVMSSTSPMPIAGFASLKFLSFSYDLSCVLILNLRVITILSFFFFLLLIHYWIIKSICHSGMQAQCFLQEVFYCFLLFCICGHWCLHCIFIMDFLVSILQKLFYFLLISLIFMLFCHFEKKSKIFCLCRFCSGIKCKNPMIIAAA